MECKECYSNNNRMTPLLDPRNCLEKHLQYICGSCGRHICIDKDEKRNVQRWNFPFKTLEIAKLYLRTADFENKSACGIYEITNEKGRKSYKIFVSKDDLGRYLSKNKNKSCVVMEPIYRRDKYIEFENTVVKKISQDEVEKYLGEQNF